MELRVGNMEVRSLQASEENVTKKETNRPTYQSGQPVMSRESINKKPYFVMFVADPINNGIKEVYMPISVYIYQDMMNFTLMDYAEGMNVELE